MAKTSGELELERRREAQRKRNEIIITDFSTCYNCKSKGLSEQDNFCPHCSFPQRGTQEQMQGFMRNIVHKEYLLKEQHTAINKARNILFACAAFCLLKGLLLGFVTDNSMPDFVFELIESLIYLGFAFWCMKHPFPAILTGFIFYIVIQVMFAVIAPITIIQGIFWKIAIISGFIYGYKGALKAKELEKELKDIKKADGTGTANAMS